jgi:hypothetical protein
VRDKIRLPVLKVTKSELLADLRRVSQSVGGDAIKGEDYRKHGKYSYTSMRNHFGSWKNALDELGLQRSRSFGTSEEELFANLRDVWVKLGRQPKYREMTIPFSKFSASAYRHRFGNWTQTLLAFQTYLEQDGVASQYRGLADTVTPGPTKHRTPRDPNWKTRFLILKRDGFRCVACGRSPAKDPGVELHVDHIKPWVAGGETEFGNLQTLCKKCNLGKGDTA